MIIVTGANGFIGSSMVEKLNSEGFFNIMVVDDFRNKKSHNYLIDLHFSEMIDLESLEQRIENNSDEIEFIIHLGAITDTSVTDKALLQKYNTDYTKMIWKLCTNKQIPLIYASSAATYGAGEYGFSADHNLISKLTPLNAYGKSKQYFDLWATTQKETPYFWAGLKFFNVYGPEREGHKGKMASMIYQIEQQIKKTGTVKLFKSYNPDFADGEQKRDFIHVGKVVEVIYKMMTNRNNNGIFNVGSGKAKSFNSVVKEVAMNIGSKAKIEYSEMPNELKDHYQYFTEANNQG